MEIKIKKLHPNAVVPFKTYDSDFCYDCVAVSREEIGPNVYKYGLGIALQIDRNSGNPCIPVFARLGSATRPTNVNLAIDFRPRSSVWKTGLVLSNCIGTVDEGYTGEISAVFYHVNTSLPIYNIGDRIGQIKLGFTLPVTFVEVDELNETDRGNGGYGSTDNNQ